MLSRPPNKSESGRPLGTCGRRPDGRGHEGRLGGPRPVGRRSGASAAVERVLQPGEQPLLPGLELARWAAPRRAAWRARAAAAPVRGRAWSGSCTSTCTMRSPRPPPRRCVTPRPCSGIDWPDWVPGRMSTSSRPSSVSSGTLVPRAAAVIGMVTVQCRSSPRRWNVRVRQLVDLDVQVAGGAAAGADLALARELDAGAVVHTGRDLDREGAAGADAAVARALRARGRHHRAEALALRAGARGHDLAEEGPRHLRHLAAAAAHVAGLRGGARRRALTAAGACRRRPCRPGCPSWCRRPPRRARSPAGSWRPGRGGCASAVRAATPYRRRRP